MKRFFGFALAAILISCTKEKVQQQQENLILQAMVNGQWKVSGFDKDGTDITNAFSNYTFQFRSDLTVDAINNGIVEKTGFWNADAGAQTISSNFTNATNPLLLLNGTWTITNTTWTSVQARQTVSGELRILRLNKL